MGMDFRRWYGAPEGESHSRRGQALRRPGFVMAQAAYGVAHVGAGDPGTGRRKSDPERRKACPGVNKEIRMCIPVRNYICPRRDRNILIISKLFLALLFLPAAVVAALTAVWWRVRPPRRQARGFPVLPPKEQDKR
jgi:hypothetical protein